MSAAEKLGALLSAIARNDDGAALAGLLPQIVAVVAAAERLRNDARGGLCDDPFNSKGDKLDAALAALDKALEAVT